MSKSYSFTSSETTAGDMARAFFKFQLRLPSILIIYLSAFCVGIYIAMALNSLVYGIIYEIVVLLALPYFSYRKLRNRLQATFAPGAKLSASFTDTALHLSTPLATSDTAYSLFRAVVVQKDFVILRPKASGIYIILPRALFPDDELAAMQAHVAAASRPQPSGKA